MKMRASATPMLTLTIPTSLSPSLLFFHRRKPSFLFSNPKPFLFLLHHSSTVSSSSSSSSSSFRLRCSSSTSHSQSISESESEDGVCIEIQKLPNNSRRILSSVAINASLLAVWNVLTDYEGLADFIPGLAISQLLDRGPDYARLFQVGEQNLALGLKFNAKGVVDCYEKPLEILPSAQKREIEFNMVDGDFQLFQGKWSILQV
uniref:Coenzyme Q-binding protein COQ10 START domain-containing protein n=1 Tax=Cannabis sativa TaxID=3483 RepID=A0A803NQ47_CANSA